ncbi:MAG TPA: fructosamine kinase family protein [Longimicrobiales bacterium]|nr:fructosamine kinase family protein [Longimicrobiales bacterium]
MPNFPAPVRAGVEDALARLGLNPEIVDISPVAGGCINHGARVATAGGSFFLKWNASAPPHFFEAEADGLRALGAAGVLRVPRPLVHGGGSGAPAWLLMEYIEAGPRGPVYEETLGRGLAALHSSGATGSGFGWSRDNWIGSLPQSNPTGHSWATFWRNHRLAPQLRRARDGGFLTGAAGAVLDDVVDLVPMALADVDLGPVHLLHGDLWGGNAYPASDGAPTLIDPATYRGHGEVDLAMTELFGGFGARFYDGYREVVGISDAYGAYRRDLYQLYYLLVHVNLFGSQYERPTLAAAGRVVSTLAG